MGRVATGATPIGQICVQVRGQRPVLGCRDRADQRRRSIKMTSTMTTIRTMVPRPINMGFLSDARRPLRDGAVCT